MLSLETISTADRARLFAQRVFAVFGLLALLSWQGTQAASVAAHSSGVPRATLSARLGSAAIRLADEDFRLPNVVLSGALRLQPGISLEAFLDAGLGPSTRGSFETSLERSGGVALRFESPIRYGLSGSFTLGWVNFGVDQQSQSGTRHTERFDGVMAGLGVERVLSPDWRVGAYYRLYRLDDPLYVDSWLLGLKRVLR